MGIAIINLPFWDCLHHLFMVFCGGGLLLLYPHYGVFFVSLFTTIVILV